MKFYTKTHKFYCGIDLRAKTMYLCILDQQGEIVRYKTSTLPGRPFLMQLLGTAKTSLSVLSVYLPGIGLQISVHKKTSPLFSVTPFI